MINFRVSALRRDYNACMATAPQLPFSDIFRTAALRDPLELAGQLGDTLQLIEQCDARNVQPSEEFLEYVDSLLDQVELMEIFGRIHAA